MVCDEGELEVQIVDRYTAKEFTGPFVAAVAGATIMLLSGLLFELTDLIVEKKMPVATVLRMLVYRTPAVIVVSLPIAALFGTLLSLGRLAKDSELTTLFCTGTPFRRLALPLLLMGCLVSGLALLLNEWVVPESNHRAEQILRRAIFTDPIPTIEEGVFFRGSDERYFYVGSVDRRTNRLERVLIYQIHPGEPYPEMITAESGTYGERVWHLENGTRKRLDRQGFTLEDIHFERLDYPMAEESQLFIGNQRTTDEMTRRELAQHIRLFRRSGLDVKRFEVAYHMKAALPLAAFLWTWVGAPLSLHSARSGRFFGIVISLGLAFLYFVLSAFFRSLGGSGVLPPLAAAWATNLLYALAGLILWVRTERV